MVKHINIFTIVLLILVTISLQSQSQDNKYILCEWKELNLVEVSKHLTLRECEKLAQKDTKLICILDIDQAVIIEEE